MADAFAQMFIKGNIRLSNRAHIWPNLELEGGKPIPSP